MHAESDTWIYWQECAFTMEFWGQYIDVKPTGLSHLIFKDTGDHFTWTKVSTKVTAPVLATNSCTVSAVYLAI